MENRSRIRIIGARQNNLKGINVRIPIGNLTVITGVSGSGKSSLAFQTLYAEGQRRYIESFSSYARQFLERMDKPDADRIEGIPPAIAINQTDPVRTSRSTVGTMTEINDFLKYLFSGFGSLLCESCGNLVERDTSKTLFDRIRRHPEGSFVQITFPIGERNRILSEGEVQDLERMGFHRILTPQGIGSLREIHRKSRGPLEVLVDRLRLRESDRQRFLDSLEQAMHFGLGRGTVRIGGDVEFPFSARRHCARCDRAYRNPVPSLFSFNHPLGACDHCHGFGRTIEIDQNRVVPDPHRTLADHAIKPLSTPTYLGKYRKLMRFCRRNRIPVDVPFENLSVNARKAIFKGSGDFSGIDGFFQWLESRTYRMHIRVLLSRYRGYVLCRVCRGARLKPEGLLYRIGGKAISDLWRMSISDCRGFFRDLDLGPGTEEAGRQVLEGIRSRLRYLEDVGLGYLTLDRQSRTLSGGEVQRVGLTTALGSALVNTLYVLDEPSIGLHPRDNDRLIRILHALRDRGNTLVVVEHDPAIMRASDHLLDLGPGAGEKGGELLYQGPFQGLKQCRKSSTGQYLSGARVIPVPGRRRLPDPRSRIILRGVRCHNLNGLDVRIPREVFVCITGVSGSGKSTLVQEVLYKVLREGTGTAGIPSGLCESIEGHESVGEVILVDQTPVGRTPKSNPATYSRAYDLIRRHFASLPRALQSGYSARFFSFNTPGGRCEICEGSGHEKVEMQFLADVYVPCQECNGSRFRPEVLRIRDRGSSIHDVLKMTVNEGVRFFGATSSISRALASMRVVGLGYLRLGQPINTLSGGEAQRLKLARHIGSGRKGSSLFLFDEPTTGLHFEDIRRLLIALQSLVEEGHTVVVIEHNLEVIKTADHIIDLGPEGGAAGGRIVVEGTPEKIVACAESRTGRFLKPLLEPNGSTREGSVAESPPMLSGEDHPEIRIRGAREHNLQNLEVGIPRDRFIVVTGLSGSGKSTLAFDILYSEGQRRYLESLTTYARQFLKPLHRPEIDTIEGVPPTIAIEQRSSRVGRKSTVSTLTEIHPYLRLLFSKLGRQHCHRCDIPIQAWTLRRIVDDIERVFPRTGVRIFAPVVMGRKGYHREVLARIRREGYSRVRVDGRVRSVGLVLHLERYREHDIELLIDALKVISGNHARLQKNIRKGLRIGKGTLLVGPAGSKERLYSETRMCPRCGTGFAELDPRLFSFHHRQGRCLTCKGIGVLDGGCEGEVEDPEVDHGSPTCPDCRGFRLRPEALAVRFREKKIGEIVALPVGEAREWFESLRLSGRDAVIGRDIVREIRNRLRFLEEVGLSYLGLNRSASTLSGGEAQRLRLAAQLGSNLRGVCYVLDEPTIGLHPRDNLRLLRILKRLRNRGNTIVVVEHDEDTIRSADHIIDLGPGAGRQGGRLVAQGTLKEILSSRESITGKFLRNGSCRAGIREPRVRRNGKRLRVLGARHNNLKGIDVGFPLRAFTCVTGVSGSGKSSLVQDILFPALKGKLTGESGFSGKHRRLEGWQELRRVIEVDQSPIGRTPRSIPASYVGFLNPIRNLFELTPEARARGYSASRFSFNIGGGRCERCKGQGRIRIKMSFLPDVFVDCEACGGKRFQRNTREIRYRGKSIADVLEMTVEEGLGFFSAIPQVEKYLAILEEIGLGYLQLGQPSNTLSGGEAQRIKLAAELGKTSRGGTMYILDEPTTGLHLADIQKLVRVLHRMADRGDTVVVIEHNLEVIRQADLVVDLGPEGGDAGGYLVAAVPPRKLLSVKESRTGGHLRKYLSRIRTSAGSGAG
ncbi:MAG: excinuclease ABC subunit UvrA [Acidobacteriota bacterium]